MTDAVSQRFPRCIDLDIEIEGDDIQETRSLGDSILTPPMEWYKAHPEEIKEDVEFAYNEFCKEQERIDQISVDQDGKL